MIIDIINNDKLQLSQLSPEIDTIINDKFSLKHPKAHFINSSKGWDGWYRKYNIKNKTIARTLLLELIELLQEHDIPFDVFDKRPAEKSKPNKLNITKDLLNGIILEDHQIRALEAMCEYETGIIDASTGSGKTELIAGISKLCRCPTVIIAEQRIVIEQIKERLELREINEEGVGLFYGGSLPSGESIVVGSIQSYNPPSESLRDTNAITYLKRYENSQKFQQLVVNAELLLIDECDRSAGPHYQKLFKSFKGRRKYGFSGTPFDSNKPVEALNLKEKFGSIIHKATRKELTDIGRIIPIKYYSIGIGAGEDRYDKTAFDIAEREIMIENNDFHQLILDIVSSFPKDGTLILVDTTNIEELGKTLESKIPDSKFIYGKTTKKERQKWLDKFENREIKCLIGGKILKRGLNLGKSGVDNLILCGGGKLESDFDQKIGRAVRNNKKGWARVFDFFFLNNHYLYTHSKLHLNYAIEMGYKTTVVINGKEIDGKTFVKKKYKLQ